MKVMAYIHSLKDRKTDTNVLGECDILEHIDNNNIVAEYNGVKCRAIFNPFVSRYFVDDIYGMVEDSATNSKK